MATVALKDVRKNYGNQEVIHGVDLDVKDREFIVIVGPSGCGKSTLLRMVAGLERITSGQIWIDGRVVNELEPRQRNIAMVFQNYALYPHMSVFDNMAYGLKIAGLSRDEIKARVGKAASMLRLEPYLDRKPKQLSGGQRQRVAMGRALVREPAAFLFDEPLSNLDAKLRVQMRLEIKTLQRNVGTTSLYVTHDQVEAMTLADRLVVMNEGVAEQIATPMEVYAAPATTFVAGFIGSPAMNLMAGEMSGGAFSFPAGGSVRLREAVVPDDGRKVLLGLRPERVRAVAPSEADFSLTVAAVETLGADTLAHGRIAGENDFVVRLPGATLVAVGETIPLAIEPGAAHLFDASSGRRI